MTDNTLDLLPVCGYVKVYRYFYPVPSTVNNNICIQLSLPWLHLKQFVSNYLSRQPDLVFCLSHGLGSFMISSDDPKFVIQVRVYANVEQNKYFIEFKRECGDIFAIIKIVDKLKDELLLENEKRVTELECDAKDSRRRFYFNELNEEIKEESS